MSQDYVPLRVTARLMAPVIIDRQMPLDGLLGAIIITDPEFRRKDREARRWRRAVAKYGVEDSKRFFREQGWPIPAPGHEHFVPLAVWGHGKGHGVWVYCSSWAMPGDDAEQGTVFFNKRLDIKAMTDWIEPRRTRIETGKGELKNAHVPFLYTVTETLTWYALGLKTEIERLLDLTYAIGKKRARGFGEVRAWEVEQIEADSSVFDPDGNLMRPIPAMLLEEMNVRGEFKYSYTTYRPPYWEPRWVAKCAVAGKRTR